jgi:hypothetical protein
MNDTPRTDEWETYCDESYYHLWRVRRKNERGFNDGYHVHNGDEARALVDLLNKQDSELTAARAEIDEMDSKNLVLRQCVQASSDEQTRLKVELSTVTEQRDRLAEALQKLADCDWIITPHDRMDAVRTIAREALQSLTTNPPTSEKI